MLPAALLLSSSLRLPPQKLCGVAYFSSSNTDEHMQSLLFLFIYTLITSRSSEIQPFFFKTQRKRNNQLTRQTRPALIRKGECSPSINFKKELKTRPQIPVAKNNPPHGKDKAFFSSALNCMITFY